jgi:hypothetical protein
MWFTTELLVDRGSLQYTAWLTTSVDHGLAFQGQARVFC